ncbi:hypothetical protein QYF36_024963 [Acer negundo]|nr:hypothetical protein QYF36_024963 [Acer negundo]
MINHITSECTENVHIPIINGKKEPLYGPWFRASGFLRKSNFHSQRNPFFSTIKSNSSGGSGKGKGISVPETIVSDHICPLASKSEPDGSQKQVDMAIDSEREEEVNNLGSGGTTNTTIYGEKIVENVNGMIESETQASSWYVKPSLSVSFVKNGPIVGLAEEKPDVLLSSSPSFLLNPNFTTNLSFQATRVEENKKGQRQVRIRKLGIFSKDSVVLCGKQKNASVGKEELNGSRKVRTKVGILGLEGRGYLMASLPANRFHHQMKKTWKQAYRPADPHWPTVPNESYVMECSRTGKFLGIQLSALTKAGV